MQRELDLSKHSPAFPCPSALSVSIRVIRGSFSLPSKRLYQPLLYREPGTPAQIIAQGFAIDIQRRGQLAQGTEAREAPKSFENAFRERKEPGRVAGGGWRVTSEEYFCLKLNH
jgi:hypothetical protein